jgi:hypothetical protein
MYYNFSDAVSPISKPIDQQNAFIAFYHRRKAPDATREAPTTIRGIVEFSVMPGGEKSCFFGVGKCRRKKKNFVFRFCARFFLSKTFLNGKNKYPVNRNNDRRTLCDCPSKKIAQERKH